ncbi:hypothetical protein HUO13_32720 [Saccharopolyspora erythraea]|uniref:hypothetical protein n=1 Tax=Saccharopolyspora erythraea TaxID=1836 RepID=UPI001BAD8A68|nr:hypothetical protein [Saccharopolyspora erythraea]QUH04909.1 hypothetical protein HUO13_32720 [Saccharopolyspora erythraea]
MNELARWRQEEAGGDWTQDGNARQVAWLQAEAVNLDKQRIPVWMALACVDDAVAKIGTLETVGAHAVLPLHRRTPPRPRLVNAVEWFSLQSEAPKREFTISLYTTNGDKAFDADALVAEFRSSTTSLLNVEPVDEPSAGAPSPDELEGRWLLGDNLAQLHLLCQAREWSLDMAALVTDAVAHAAEAGGVHQPLLVSAFRRGAGREQDCADSEQ